MQAACPIQQRSSGPALPCRRSTTHGTPALCSRPVGQQQRGSVATQAFPMAGVSASVLIGAAYWLAQQQQTEQDQLEASDRRPCPSCGGSGLQPCACTRWSDGDVGCSSCSKSGWMKCSSCGGGGTAIPIKVSIRRNEGL